jgi:DNA polymerase-3 subunit gamma/tau
MLAFSPEEKETARVEPKAGQQFDGDWPALAQRLSLSGGAKELARNAELKGGGADAFELVVPKAMAHLAGEGYRDKLQAALTAHFGRRITVRVSMGDTRGASAAALEAADKGARRAEAARAVQGDSFVQDLVNLFDARVVDSTIKEKR